jgi:hypothetical protein
VLLVSERCTSVYMESSVKTKVIAAVSGNDAHDDVDTCIREST